MQSKTKMVTGAAVLSLLLIGVAPAVAVSGQGSSASVILQMAQAAHDYAQNLLTIAQQHSVDVSQAKSLISQGDKLLAQAQSEVNSNPDGALKDALQAMRDYRDAARYLQSQLGDFVKDSNNSERLQNAIQRAEERAKELKTIVDKACSSKSAPADLCKDAKDALARAMTDLESAAKTASSDPDGAAKLLADAAKLLGQTHADLAKIAEALKSDRGADFVQNVLQKKLAEVQEMVQKATLSSSLAQKVQDQLKQTQSLIDSALADFKAGNFVGGVHDAKQAMELLRQIVTEIR